MVAGFRGDDGLWWLMIMMIARCNLINGFVRIEWPQNVPYISHRSKRGESTDKVGCDTDCVCKKNWKKFPNIRYFSVNNIMALSIRKSKSNQSKIEFLSAKNFLQLVNYNEGIIYTNYWLLIAFKRTDKWQNRQYINQI